MKEIKLFINGEFESSSSNLTFKTYDPDTLEELAICHLPSNEDIHRAIQSAHDAFYNPLWADMSQKGRAEILLKVSELIKERKKELIEWEMKDSGSLIRKAKADIHNAASFFKVMSKTAENFTFLQQDERASKASFSFNERYYKPVGVCAQIIPWNFPLVMAAWKIGPILATGCTCILKSAQETPITASILGEILKDAGVPSGVVNIITGGAEVGRELIKDSRVQKIAFTGSTSVGKEILKTAAENVTKVTLELGGKSPNIILDDADLSIAVDGALYAFLYHSGQACDSGTRLLVDEKIYPTFLEQLIKRVQEIPIGKTQDPSSGMGPVINEKQCERIMNYINKTKEEGAKLLYGGDILSKLPNGEEVKGNYIQPTLFEISSDNTIFHEEIFGPVLGITTFSSDDEAIKLANNSTYGLAGAVWSQDTERAKAMAKKLEAGTVWINEYHLLNPGMPFGGFKESGLGREMGIEGIMAYLEVQHLWTSDCLKREEKPWFDALF